MSFLVKTSVVLLAATVPFVALAEPTRSWGTVDSFGLLRWERFSENPAIGTLVALLAKPSLGAADLLLANRAVAKKTNDLPSRALRAELRLRVDRGASLLSAPTAKSVAKMSKPDRFEASYLFYQMRRSEHPERYGITTDFDKASPPFTLVRQHDLVTIAVSAGQLDTSWSETLLSIDWGERIGDEIARQWVAEAYRKAPRLWELEALRLSLLRCGGYTLTGTYPGVLPEKLKQFPQALVLAQRLRREHPECRVLDQMAGVAAWDLHKYDLARTYFDAYLAHPDPGLQGERRSRDVRELLARIPKA